MPRKHIEFWKGKCVLITGASSGLGRALVEELTVCGVHFGLLSRRFEALEELAGRLKNSGSTFWLKKCDVQNRNQVYTAIREFQQHAGRIDVVWVNSGISAESSLEQWDWDRVEAVIDTNLKGAIYTIRACLEVMAPRHCGSIVAIGSATAMRGMPTRGIYSMTKVALEWLMESLAAELPELHFITIHPGFVDTPITQNTPVRRIWLMSPEKAARLMIRAVMKRKRIFIYPRKMNALFHLARWLPNSLYLRLARKILAQQTRKHE